MPQPCHCGVHNVDKPLCFDLQMDEDAYIDAEEQRRAMGVHLKAVVLQPLEACIEEDYPLRSPGCIRVPLSVDEQRLHMQNNPGNLMVRQGACIWDTSGFACDVE